VPGEHLTADERYVISHMHLFGHSHAEIARRLGRHRGTIGREIQRNRHNVMGRRVYLYDAAERKARERRVAANQRYKLDQPSLARYVQQGLRRTWSPQQIAGRLELDHRDDPSMRITHEAIYQWVYRHHDQGWHRHLRRRRPRRRRRIPGRGRRGQIRDRIGIEHRPAIVNARGRFGDWEADTMQGATGRGGLATHVDRRSRYLLARRIDDKRAATFSRITIDLLRELPATLRKTMTADNGKEFADFKRIEQRTGARVYFADPYAAWQRGTNENTNGLLREFFPKGTDFHRVSHRAVAKATRLINNRPRKCLNYRTPTEVISKIPGVALRN